MSFDPHRRRRTGDQMGWLETIPAGKIDLVDHRRIVGLAAENDIDTLADGHVQMGHRDGPNREAVSSNDRQVVLIDGHAKRNATGGIDDAKTNLFSWGTEELVGRMEIRLARTEKGVAERNALDGPFVSALISPRFIRLTVSRSTMELSVTVEEKRGGRPRIDRNEARIRVERALVGSHQICPRLVIPFLEHHHVIVRSIVGIVRLDRIAVNDQRAHQPIGILLSMVRVIPEGARLRHVESIQKLLLRFDRTLSDVLGAVGPRVPPHVQTVEVDRRRVIADLVAN